jgi:hypothetical protein
VCAGDLLLPFWTRLRADVASLELTSSASPASSTAGMGALPSSASPASPTAGMDALPSSDVVMDELLDVLFFYAGSCARWFFTCSIARTKEAIDAYCRSLAVLSPAQASGASHPDVLHHLLSTCTSTARGPCACTWSGGHEPGREV